MYWVITFFVIIFLIAVNAFYVAAEFSTVSSRPARLHHISEGGNPAAKSILSIVENPRALDTYIATCQVGITISSLVLGYFGQSRLSDYLTPILSRFSDFSEAAAHSISATIILIVLTILQVLLGELVPKNIGLQHPERLAIFTARLMDWSSKAFRPLIWLFNGSGLLLMRLFRMEPTTEHTHIHSPQEIAILVEESRAGGAISSEEHRLINNTLLLWEAPVRHIMIPRSKMLAAPDTTSKQGLFNLLALSPFSRVPIYKKTIDNVIGVIHLRDLLCARSDENNEIHSLIHPVTFVPENATIKKVFSNLQEKQSQVTVVLDEYGGTAGMVTLEDLIEQIFGELQDEFDHNAAIIKIDENGRVRLLGATLIREFNKIMGLSIPEDSFDTIGGLLMNTFGYIPREQDEIEINKIGFKVEKIIKHGIAEVSMHATEQQIQQIRDYFNK